MKKKKKEESSLVRGIRKILNKPEIKEKKPIFIVEFIFYLFGVFFLIHLAACQTFYPRFTFTEAVSETFMQVSTSPFTLMAPPKNAGSYILLFTILLILGTWFWIASEKANEHARFKTEHGSARWNEDLDAYNRRFTDPPQSPEHNGNYNMVLTQNIYLSMNTRQTRRNNNILVIGGSGSGKSRFFVKPNICEMPINTSFVSTDPSGELSASLGSMLTDNGFKVKIFNLVNMNESNHYNPLVYIKKEIDVFMLVDCILENTTDPQHKGGDDFWEKAQKMMLQAFILALWMHGDDEEIFGKGGWPKNMDSIMKMITGCDIDENDSSSAGMSKTDQIFNNIRQKYHDDDISVRQYDKFMLGAGKTLKSVLISAAARLSVFDGQDLINLTATDDIELDKIGDEKTALFIIIPQDNKSFNFLAAMMYTQLFQSLYYHAGNECRGNYMVVDKNGENVKIFKVPHIAQEIIDENENEEEIEVDLNKIKDKNNEKKNLKKRKTFLKRTKEKEEDNEEKEENKNAPDDDPGEEFNEIEDEAIKYCQSLKNCKLTKKGNRYYIKTTVTKKIKEGEKEREIQVEEIVGNPYTNKNFAIERIENLKHSTIKRCGLWLPYHVRFLLDEFANIGQIPDFNEKLSTMRKYEISCSIILQNLAQIKNMYKDNWGTTLGNCDTLLFLGSPEQDTLEYISKRLGKKTEIVRTNGMSRGGKSSSSVNYQKVGRELMLPEEIALMDENQAIVMIRNQYPFKDRKFKYENHKNFKLTEDGDSSRVYHFIPPRIKENINRGEICNFTESQINKDATQKKELNELKETINSIKTSISTERAKMYSSGITSTGDSVSKPSATKKEVEEAFRNSYGKEETGELDIQKLMNIQIESELASLNEISETDLPEPSTNVMSNIV